VFVKTYLFISHLPRHSPVITHNTSRPWGFARRNWDCCRKDYHNTSFCLANPAVILVGLRRPNGIATVVGGHRDRTGLRGSERTDHPEADGSDSCFRPLPAAICFGRERTMRTTVKLRYQERGLPAPPNQIRDSRVGGRARTSRRRLPRTGVALHALLGRRSIRDRIVLSFRERAAG
jgi:hypothetical protein